MSPSITRNRESICVGASPEAEDGSLGRIWYDLEVGVLALDATSDAFFTSSEVALDDSAPEPIATLAAD